LLVAWAEADLVVADEFREGNVPARQAPLACVKAAFAALPETVSERFFRGDSACHENELLGWLSDPQRTSEPGGAIGFAVSAVQSEALAAALRAVTEATWQTFGTEADGTLRQWADLDFVPSLPSERKDAKPLRYVGLRLVKAQGELFADGSRYHYHAVITNREVAGDELLRWHRVLKSGCRVQAHQHRSAAKLACAIAIDTVIAWRAMLLTLLGREAPDLSCELIFEPWECRLLGQLQSLVAPETMRGSKKRTAAWHG
jgi:hypothetical protein